MSVYSQDVLEDLFATDVNKNARLCRQSDAHFFQSTQVNHFDVPYGTIVIQPDFPLSPLHGTAPAIPVSDISPTVQSSEAEMCIVTPAQSRPITSVIDSTHSLSSHVTLPSAVFDRIHDLFCVSNSDVNQNRFLDTVSGSTASDAGQLNRSGEELVTDVVQAVFTAAMSCSGDFSPLDSSYVDAGRMAYTESDINVGSEVCVVTAGDAPVLAASIKNSTTELRISNIRSLRNNTNITLPEVTSVKSSFLPSKAKNALKGDQIHCREKNLRSPTDNSAKFNLKSGSKRKQSLRKQNAPKSDVLFKQTEKVKCVSKKRRLYRGNMLMEGDMGEQSHQIGTDVHVSLCKDDVETHMHRQRDGKILPPTSASAAVSVPLSLTRDGDKTSTYPAVHSVNDVIVSSPDSVEVTGIQSGARWLIDATQHVVPFGDAILIVSPTSSAQQVQDVQYGRAVTAKTSQGLETERGVADVVTMSAISVPVSGDRVCAVSGSVDIVSLPKPTVCVPSSEYHNTDHNKNIATNSDATDNHADLSSETANKENTCSTAGLCVPTQSTNVSSSPSLLCGQKQSGASYHLSNITISGCCLSSVETPYLPSHSCSLQDRKQHHVAEESIGYHTPQMEAANFVSPLKGDKDQLMQSKACPASNELSTSTTCHKEQSSRVLSAASAITGICTSTDAAVFGTETVSKQSSSDPSNGSGKLTMPTPKNSLTCYQPAKSLPSTAQVSDSSLVSQTQLNYEAIRVLLFYNLKFLCHSVEGEIVIILVCSQS